MVKAEVCSRSEINAAGLSADSPCATCSDVTQDTALTWRRRVFSYQRSALETSALLPFTPLRRYASALHHTMVWSSAWLDPCARVGGMVCAASPSKVTAPEADPRGIGWRKWGYGERARSSSVRFARTRSTHSDQPVKLDRITSIGRCGLTKPYDHGKSNHHCTSDPPAGHTPAFPCSPMTII